MYWFVYLKKKPGILLKGYQKTLEALNALIASWKLKQKPEKSCTWATDESMYKVSGICLMYMRPRLTGKTWKTTIDKLILVIANKDREACVNGSNTHKDVVSGDTPITTFWSTFDARNENRSLVAKLPLKKTSGLFRIPHPGLSTFYFSYRLHVFQIMVSSFQ